MKAVRQTSPFNVHLEREKLFTHTIKTQNSSMGDYGIASHSRSNDWDIFDIVDG